ncbi:hypothetical protein ANTQUA_LOCUS4995 [Anthophora quadrimaculata]
MELSSRGKPKWYETDALAKRVSKRARQMKKQKGKRERQKEREREEKREKCKKRKQKNGEEGGKEVRRKEEQGRQSTSSDGDLKLGAALSSLNILADLISPALFQR